jgi:hypothetical protein
MNDLGHILGQGLPPSQQQELERLGSGFKGEAANNELFVFVVGAVVVLVVLLLALHYLTRKRESKAKARPDYLAAATRILGLTREERANLARLAARARWAHPAAMLLSPANLAHACHKGMPAAGDAELYRRVDALCRKLFDQPLPEATASPNEAR